MLLKYLQREFKLLPKLKYTFAQPPKRRTQAPKFTRQKPSDKIDPKNVDYSKVPQYIRKGVKAYVQATNILVSSEAELQTIALREIILQERDKFKTTLDQMGSPPVQKVQKTETQSTQKQQNEVKENHYDLIKAIRFTTNVSSILMGVNLLGYGILSGLKKYELMGFFLGLSMNPSVITLTGLAIGFNAASWIIIQSLQLSIRDPNELTPKTISLTNCGLLMYLQAISIAGQTCALSYYLMQPNPFANISYLIGSFALSQVHLVYSIIRATGGYRFDFFSRLLFMQMTVGMLIVVLTYNLFNKIDECGEIGELRVDAEGAIAMNEGVLLVRGYRRFMEEFKEKKITVVKGESINQLINEQKK